MASNRKRGRKGWGSKSRYKNDYINQSAFSADKSLENTLDETSRNIRENAKYASSYYTRVEDGKKIREVIPERTIVPLEVQVRKDFRSPSPHAVAFGDEIAVVRATALLFNGILAYGKEYGYDRVLTIEEAEDLLGVTSGYVGGIIYARQYQQSVYVYSGNGKKRQEIVFSSPLGGFDPPYNFTQTSVRNYTEVSPGVYEPCSVYFTTVDRTIYWQHIVDSFVIPVTEKSRIHVCYSLWNYVQQEGVRRGYTYSCVGDSINGYGGDFIFEGGVGDNYTVDNQTIRQVYSLLVTEDDVQVIDTPTSIRLAVYNIEPLKDEGGIYDGFWTEAGSYFSYEEREYWHWNGSPYPWPTFASWNYESPTWPFQEKHDWPLWANPQEYNFSLRDTGYYQSVYSEFTHLSSSPLIFHIIDNLRGITTEGVYDDSTIFNRIPFVAMIPWDVNRPSSFWVENYRPGVDIFWESSFAETKWLAGKRKLYLSEAQKENNPELAEEFEELLLPEDWDKMDAGVNGPVDTGSFTDNGYLEIMEESLWALSPNRLMDEPLPKRLYFTSTFGLESYCKKQVKNLGYDLTSETEE